MNKKVFSALLCLAFIALFSACKSATKKESRPLVKVKKQKVKTVTFMETKEFKIQMPALKKGQKDKNLKFSRKSALHLYNLIAAKEKLPLNEKRKLINAILKVMPKGRFTAIILKKSLNAFYGGIMPSAKRFVSGSIYKKGRRTGTWGFHLDYNGNPIK